ncbi:hypothetical protein NKI56_21575 [Mesorhizobium sp. M0622]
MQIGKAMSIDGVRRSVRRLFGSRGQGMDEAMATMGQMKLRQFPPQETR